MDLKDKMLKDKMLKDKILKLNLLTLTPTLIQYICEFDPVWGRNESELGGFYYAKFFNGEVILYTKEYIDNITIEQFNKDFVEYIYTRV